MARVIVALKGSLDGPGVCRIVQQFKESCAQTSTGDVLIDFERLTYIKPTGVILLSNFLTWLDCNSFKIDICGHRGSSAALKFLAQTLFFKNHFQKEQEQSTLTHPNTIPLEFIAHAGSHAWLRNSAMPWLASTLRLTKASLYPLQTCLSEIFNNIKDHSARDTGESFIRYFPSRQRIGIFIADCGCGIPAAVRRVLPDLDDNQAILRAVQLGFTSQSTRGNYGIGLDYFLATVILANGGTVTIYSLNGHVLFYRSSGVIASRVLSTKGYCPGTVIDISLRTDTIEHLDDEPEDLEW